MQLRKPLLALLVISSLALAGCSAGPAAGPSTSATQKSDGGSAATEGNGDAAEQTTAEACALLSTRMEAATEGMNAAMDSLSKGDSAAAIAAFTEFQTDLDNAVAELSNAEVKAAGGEFVEAFGGLSDIISTAADGSDPTALLAQLGPAGQSLQDAGTKISALCGAA